MAHAKTSVIGRRKWNLARPFRHDGGMAWVAKLPPQLGDETDNNDYPYRSSLRLLENVQNLGLPMRFTRPSRLPAMAGIPFGWASFTSPAPMEATPIRMAASIRWSGLPRFQIPEAFCEPLRP
jgi:hypothetical protein